MGRRRRRGFFAAFWNVQLVQYHAKFFMIMFYVYWLIYIITR